LITTTYFRCRLVIGWEFSCVNKLLCCSGLQCCTAGVEYCLCRCDRRAVTVNNKAASLFIKIVVVASPTARCTYHPIIVVLLVTAIATPLLYYIRLEAISKRMSSRFSLCRQYVLFGAIEDNMDWRKGYCYYISEGTWIDFTIILFNTG
jgi:hypothetical protein